MIVMPHEKHDKRYSFFLLLIFVLSGGEGFSKSLHIPRVYFKRFLPVSNLVGLC